MINPKATVGEVYTHKTLGRPYTVVRATDGEMTVMREDGSKVTVGDYFFYKYRDSYTVQYVNMENE